MNIFTPKKNCKLLIFIFLGILGNQLNAQTVFWSEDFETDGTGTRYTMNNQFKDGSSDYFGHIESTSPSSFQFVGCITETIDVLNNPTGFSGSYFVGGEDMNDTGGLCNPTVGGTGANEQRNVAFLNSAGHAINIAGASAMTFRMLVAATAPTGCNNSDYDYSTITGLSDGIQVFYTIDGGGEVKALRFSPDINCTPGDTSNETLYHDTDMDGDGQTGGVAEGPMITSAFQEFNFVIPAGGTTLELRIELTSGTGDEELFIDDLTLEAVTVPLPIELSSFDVEKNDEGVRVFWTTATETENKYFEIEHSLDGTRFESIGQVEGAGTSTQSISYSFIHNSPEIGLNYYRIKQVDFDGTFSVSSVKTINYERDDTVVKISPNPFSDRLKIDFPQNVNKTTPVLVYDLHGRIVVNDVLEVGQHSKQLNLSNLEKGIYILQIGNDISKITQRIAKID